MSSERLPPVSPAREWNWGGLALHDFSVANIERQPRVYHTGCHCFPSAPPFSATSGRRLICFTFDFSVSFFRTSPVFDLSCDDRLDLFSVESILNFILDLQPLSDSDLLKEMLVRMIFYVLIRGKSS